MEAIERAADKERQAVEVPNQTGQKSYAELASGKSRVYRFWKRFFDITLCSLALVVLSPVLLLTAVAVKAEDGGPVLFIQERNGLNGKVFRMYKFRTMCPDAPKLHQQLMESNELDGPAFKMKNDPRVTKTGKFLRKTSIDELPQLLNIIRGEMSIVGPRPLPTYETARCNAYQNQRLLVKPGLTCYWQCSGRSNVSFSQWIEMDLQYIGNSSLWVDFKLICRTVVSILKFDGAY